MSEYFSSIKENSVNHGRLVRKRFDFNNNDTEENNYVIDSGSVDYRTSGKDFVLSSSASSISGHYDGYRIVVAGDFDAERRIDKYILKEYPNLIPYSEEFDNAAWTNTGSLPITANDAIAPDGSTTADLINGLEAGMSLKQIVYGNAAIRHEPSFYIKQVTATGVAGFIHPKSSLYGSWTVDLSLLESGWNRITRDHAAVTIIKEFFGNVGQLGIIMTRSSGPASLSFHLWGISFVVGEVSGIYVKREGTTSTEPIKVANISADWPSTITTSSTYEVIR